MSSIPFIHNTERRIPFSIIISSLLVILLAFFTQFFFEILVSIIVLLIIFEFFWRPYHPPIILFALVLIWFSITTGIYYVAITHDKITSLLWRPFYSAENIYKAYWYSIIGLLSFTIGIKLGVGSATEYKLDLNKLLDLDIVKLIIVFIFYNPLTDFFFHKTKIYFTSISQFFYMLKLFKWSLFFLITAAVFYSKKYKELFWIVFTLGVIMGFASYFSAFKNYFLIFPIGYLAVKKLTPRQTLVISFFSIILLLIAVYWSYIKGDYRQYLSGGQREQKVVVSKKQAIKKFFSYAKQFDKERFKLGEQALIKRIFYIEYFSATIRFIPTYRDFMNGYNTLRAIKHVLMPRFLFPNKPPLDDSKHTMQLTGIYVASAKQGTSISTGFMAEFYADYGPFYMHVALILLGLTVGLFYRIVVTSSPDVNWGFALAVPVFFLISNYGKDLTKFVGDIIWYIFSFLLLKFLILNFVYKFFNKK